MSLCYTVYNNNNTNNDISQCSRYKYTAERQNAAYNFPGTHCSYELLVLGIERHNRLGWTAFSGSLV